MSIILRPLAQTDSLEALTALLHRAYAGLAAMGFNYTAVDQSVDVTRQRVAKGMCLLAIEGGAIVGTVMFHPPGGLNGTPRFEQADVATIGQFAVDPAQQGKGIGHLLLGECERRARDIGATELALDTSEGAHHLINWYAREGFKTVETVRWAGKTYRSVVMSKVL